MSEILIHYDYNGGYFCREHYVPTMAFGIGGTVEEAVMDWIRKNFKWAADEGRIIRLLGYRFLLMDETSEKSFGADDVTKDHVRQWERWANNLTKEEFIPRDVCPHCEHRPFTPYTT